ncbi:MAG: hypothetical protein LBP62_00780 [Clostridiales bacterium]|jgi:hypothetical protein|nr:hypothetical protein [Clostridiales bacterium]
MNYGDIKRLDTIVTKNEYFENKIGAAEFGGVADAASAPVENEKKSSKKLSVPRPNFAFLKALKAKFDVYDAIMIPVGAGILVAFVMLVLKII